MSELKDLTSKNIEQSFIKFLDENHPDIADEIIIRVPHPVIDYNAFYEIFDKMDMETYYDVNPEQWKGNVVMFLIMREPHKLALMRL